MRGMQPLIDMRRRGFKPAVVFLDVDGGARNLPAWAQWQNCHPHLCEIDIERTDAIERMDLRPLVGLTVMVSGAVDARVKRVAEMATEAGATRVISTLMDLVHRGEEITAKAIWVHDTQGAFEESRDGATHS
jgi:hypothetical protein